MKYLRRVLPFLRPYRHLALCSVLLIALGSAAALLAPWPLKVLIDSVLGDHPLSPWLARLLGPIAADRFWLMVAVVVGGLMIVLLQHALSVVDNYVNTKIHQHMVLDFRSDLFEHAQRLSLAYHDSHRSGAMIYGINFQADAAARLVMAIPPLAQSALTLVGMFWILLRIDWQLALLSLTVMPPLYASVGYYVKHIQKRLRHVKGMEARSLSIIHESMSMLRVIVAFGRQRHEYDRFRDQGRRAVDARVGLTVRQTLFALVVNGTTAAGTALVLGFGAYNVMRGRLTIGELLVVLAYLASVYKPLEAISTTIGSLQDVMVALGMAFRIRDAEPDIRDAPDAVAVERARGHLTFDNVGFAYSERTDTLRGVSFDAPPGSVIGIVGPTGAGKSTLVSLIPRFYDVAQGRVLLDGKDIRELTLDSLREQVSVVLQEPLLFSGTIAENIRYGRLDATMQEVRRAACAANAHAFIMKLPKGYRTVLGERGVTLSGGERQRIAVARAFLKDSPILILDEPTSSIDSKTEAVLLRALDRLMVGRTTFIIAHRLATLRRADLILVLNEGRIVERGTHEELLRAHGLYRELFQIQNRRGPGGARRLPPQSALGLEPQSPV